MSNATANVTSLPIATSTKAKPFNLFKFFQTWGPYTIPVHVIGGAMCLISFYIFFMKRKDSYKDAIFTYWRVYMIFGVLRATAISLRYLDHLFGAFKFGTKGWLPFLVTTSLLHYSSYSLNVLLSSAICLYQTIVLFFPTYYFFNKAKKKWHRLHAGIIVVCVILAFTQAICMCMVFIAAYVLSDSSLQIQAFKLSTTLKTVYYYISFSVFACYGVLMVFLTLKGLVKKDDGEGNGGKDIDAAMKRVLWIGMLTEASISLYYFVSEYNYFEFTGIQVGIMFLATDGLLSTTDPIWHLWKNTQFRNDFKALIGIKTKAASSSVAPTSTNPTGRTTKTTAGGTTVAG